MKEVLIFVVEADKQNKTGDMKGWADVTDVALEEKVLGSDPGHRIHPQIAVFRFQTRGRFGGVVVMMVMVVLGGRLCLVASGGGCGSGGSGGGGCDGWSSV